ncbi:aminoacylase-1-like [Zophobas morio]|uniref:aminoacylase-1-like n=1 Tax=Zophobas morio TaxID=2755281 RepID=UPI0030834B74
MASCPLPPTKKNPLDTQAINNFCEYLQIPSVHPNINYDDCVQFLQKQAKTLDLSIKVHNVVPKKPIVVLTWIGTEPNLPSIFLNSHMDVVPVYEDKWTHKPFSAHIDEHNNIYARGTQDMKSVGIQYLEAIRRLKQRGVALKRTIHVSFVPDEETGGIDGMKKYVHTTEFKEMNVGVALDESAASSTDAFKVYYAERCLWQFHIHCPGNPGHGSLLLENTAGEKVAYILKKVYEFRNEQVQILKDNPDWITADVTTINLTKITGGVQTNVIPPEFVLSFDCRIPPKGIDFEKWEKTINQWCKEAGKGVWVEFDHKESPIPPTKLDNSNIYWVAFKKATDKMGLTLKIEICGGATDACYVRDVGIPAIGFSPMNNTPILLHSHDEYLNVDTFLKGIEIYCEILTSMGNKIK